MNERTRQIINLLLERKYSMSQIARMTNCSKQNVWQTVRIYKIEIFPSREQYMTTKEASRELGYSRNSIVRAIEGGKLSGQKISGRWFVRRDRPFDRSCIICGNSVPKERRKCCSVECYRIREKKLNENAKWRTLKRSFDQKFEGTSVDYIRKSKENK